VLSSSIFDAFKEQIKAECGDKTFLLIIIFTISWSNWHIDMARPKKESKEKEETEK
jgi:putative Ca2+/H+ antiporter (TMEM165/GDT1 family)